jgi:hypothetical protein
MIRRQETGVWRPDKIIELELGTWNWLNHGRFNPDMSTGRRHVLSGELEIG